MYLESLLQRLSIRNDFSLQPPEYVMGNDDVLAKYIY